MFLAFQAVIVVGEPLCDVGTPFLSSNNFTQGHLLKTEWLISDVMAVGSPDRTKRAILGMIFARCFFWSIQATFVVGEPLCDLGTPS